MKFTLGTKNVTTLLLSAICAPSAIAQGEPTGPNGMAVQALHELGLDAGAFAHVGAGANCLVDQEIVLKVVPFTTLETAKAKGLPILQSGPHGERVVGRNAEVKVVSGWGAVLQDPATSSASCWTAGEDDTPNCCNYESIPTGKVYLMRPYRKVIVKTRYKWAPVEKVQLTVPPLGPIEIPLPPSWLEVDWGTVTDVGETLDLGKWAVVRSDVLRDSVCMCHIPPEDIVVGETKIPVPEFPEGPLLGPDWPSEVNPPTTPGGPGSPPAEGIPPKIIWPGWDDSPPPAPATTPPTLPVCTAENDFMTGGGAWVTKSIATEWNQIAYAVCIGDNPVTCELVFQQWIYNWPSKFQWSRGFVGSIQCFPKEGHVHDSHAGCAHGCELDVVTIKFAKNYSREASFSPELDPEVRISCFNIGEKIFENIITGYEVALVDDLDGAGQPADVIVNKCGCAEHNGGGMDSLPTLALPFLTRAGGLLGVEELLRKRMKSRQMIIESDLHPGKLT